MGEIDDALHNLEQEKKAHMAKLVEMAENQDAEICGRKLTQVAGKKTVQYAKALKALAPDADLAPYTSTGSSYWIVMKLKKIKTPFISDSRFRCLFLHCCRRYV